MREREGSRVEGALLKGLGVHRDAESQQASCKRVEGLGRIVLHL